MVAAVQQNKQYLSDVDGLVGDGDHGMNMNKGFTIYQEQLGEKETSFSDGLFDLGSVLLNKIGGSMGPIYGTIFMDMSDAAEDAEEIGLDQFIGMLEAGLEGLYGIVEARPGDKTLGGHAAPGARSAQSRRTRGKRSPARWMT
jgi:dihydroxyacetone kinase-like protein